MMDPVTLGMAKAAARKYGSGASLVAWLGDSLTANGSLFGGSSGQAVGTVNTATAVGATTLIMDHPHTAAAGYANVTPPTANGVFVIEPGTPREETVMATAVTGTGPYTLTVPALAYAHTAGATIRNLPRAFNAESVPMWMTILSAGSIRYGGIFAHGGYTTDQILNVYLPLVLAQKPTPSVVVVNVGTNDTYALTVLPKVRTIIDSIINNGSVPLVVGAMTSGSPNPIGSEIFNRVRWNEALATECAARGIPFVNPSRVLADTATGGMKAAYAKDNTHLGPVGARVFAQQLLDALTPMRTRFAVDPTVPHANSLSTDPLTFPAWSNNALFVTDSNADGVPDTWTKTYTSSGGDTTALITEPDVGGKMFELGRGANATGECQAAGNMTLIPGNKYRATVTIKTTGVDAAYDALATTSSGITNSTFSGFSLRLMNGTTDPYFSLIDWKRDIPLRTFTFEFICPPTLTAAAWTLILKGGASVPAYKVAVQLWMTNLTRASG